MTADPRSEEGSQARADDRGREEDLGFVVERDRPSLGDPGVVQALVSEFAGAVVGVRKRFNEGKLDGDKAQERVRDLAREYGDTIMGRDRRYASLPWNDPARLGRRIALAVPAVEGVTDPGEQLFMTIGTSLVELAVEHEEGRMSDDDVKQKAQEMLADTVGLILGVR